MTASARAAAREQRHLPGDSINAEHEEEEERVLVRIECSKRARFLWNEARRLAPRMAGRTLAQWEVAERIAAEASSAPGPYGEAWQHEPWRSFAADGPGRPAPASDQSAGCTRGDASSAADANGPRDSHEEPDSERSTKRQSDSQEKPVDRREEESDPDPVVSPIERELERLVELNAFELDTAMRRVRTAMQQRQARLGSTLGLFLDLRLHEQLGYACESDYVRERLGLPDRTARDLVRVAQSARGKSPVLASAYERGELSWLRVLALLPVAKPWNVSAWITRAGEVTLRRLNDEVEWALAQADRAPESVAAMPPPVGSDLGLRDGDRRMCAHEAPGDDTTATTAAADDRRMCAHEAPRADTTARSRDQFWGVIGRIRITFQAPVSVSTLFRTVMQGFASPTEPRWLAIERMLEQVVGEWRRQPTHRDPVFERDGYRCTAPGCSSYANLHDHHIVPRSAGGSNEQSNRTTLCAWHHLRAVHGGLATATGQAPDAIDWELGLAHGRKPLLRLRGDRYFRGANS
ncbi:MAG: HNH endonuclease signature motif containing protein [Candidatus Binatia bacterium]